ncbi:winged helix-turn-helix domain-containing protein [Sulfitobacter sp. F26169L]|uniref:ArsR/SmtB family transcription factor n=1 Tax=Sulfitobacter sp. F26169L TaxID=2996015 RepID=UPI002260D096|nr:winged helix-turn-helix domain-containing protein [Sulfitobacter sp. F26169L]MCX7567818.1 winged helix-turn-helix domain-containing protein [Sulfitobacter sp. F26169L]
MKEGPDIARIASLIGDPARANILGALMTGKALTATELAGEAGVTVQTASTHLSKLEVGGLTVVRKSGRHKYISLAGPDVAEVLEALMGLAAGAGHMRTRTGPADSVLRDARVCYNHLAGSQGIAMFDAMVARGFLQVNGDVITLTPAGNDFVTGFGVDLAALQRARAPVCRACLDWSARRTHLAGGLGRALLARIEVLGWAKRQSGSRAVRFTTAGRGAFRAQFGIKD